MALPEPSHEKELKHIRIIQKHETEANWNKATIQIILLLG